MNQKEESYLYQRRIEPTEVERPADAQDQILRAIQSLEKSPEQGLRGLVNPWGLDFWDPSVANYYQTVNTFPSLADRREEEEEEQAWSTEVDHYNLDQLNTEYFTTYPTTTTADRVEQSSPSSWEELGIGFYCFVPLGGTPNNQMESLSVVFVFYVNLLDL